MNYQEQSSDISSAQEQEEQELTDKLFRNYKQIKDSIKRQHYDKSSSKKSMGSVQRAIEIEEQKNLETRITLTEKQLAKARQNNILLLKKLGQAEEHAEFLKFQMEKYKREKEEEIASYCNFIQSLKQDLMVARQSKIDAVRTSESKDLMVMRSTIDSREKQVSRLNLKVKSLEFSLQEKDGMLKSNAFKIEQLSMKIQELQSKQQQLVFNQQSHGSQILELEQARSAVQRLLTLLKTTEQYKTFYNHSDNYDEVYFLQKVAKKLKSGGLSISPERKPVCKCKQIKIDERMLWSPTNCYKALLNIKQKYEVLNEACIQQILFELNRLWLSKEDHIASKIKEQYQGELQRMKKKTFERYDELVARKQIERLKKELQQNRFTKKNPQEQFALLKNIGQYEDELRIKQKEIKLLNERIKLMQAENVNYDRVLYLEGALWLIDKVLDEVNFYQQEIRLTEQKLHDKYEADEHAVELSRMLNSCFESFRQITSGLVQKLLLMKETTLKKVGVEKKDNYSYQE